MESKEYFEKVMQGHNQNRKGRSLRSISPLQRKVLTH